MLVLALAGCAAPTGSIGVSMVRRGSGAIEVREAPADMTGAKAGLQSGDEIVSIDGADARGMTDEELHRRLSGPIGSRVALTVVRDGAVVSFSVPRGAYRPAGRR